MDLNLTKRVLDLTVAIQQIPAPTFSEDQRAAFLQAQFRQENLADIEIDQIGNVYGRFPGIGEVRPLVVSAHLDTVFPAYTDLQVTQPPNKIAGPGIGDNSLGLAGLIGLLWSLKARDTSLPGDLWLVANVGEEGLGDLKGIKAVVDRFGEQPLAYIVLEGMALGQVYHRGLGVHRYRITTHTEGGHSWVDYGCPSAIHELATLIEQISSLDLPENPRTSLNVGVIQGGTSVNTIAAEAHLELDLRSEDAKTLSALIQQVENLVREANRSEVSVTAETIGQRPAGEIPPDHPLVRLAVRALEEQHIQPCLNIGSTDANIPLSRGLAAISVGLTRGGGAHTLNEYIYTEPLANGLEQVHQIVTKAFETLS
jgi:tripeptide aminopeptidase